MTRQAQPAQTHSPYRWAQEGEVVEEFTELCQVQSDKASVDITSRYAGIIRRLHHSPGDMVKVCSHGRPLQHDHWTRPTGEKLDIEAYALQVCAQVGAGLVDIELGASAEVEDDMIPVSTADAPAPGPGASSSYSLQ